ncbi:adenosylcobinamide-GDP ribazoletransferase [Salinarimonas rosea]|uniref:adenosylcobinamide-GDP ribazoletransferase n=1 Tax=Salinarimonas rosea TaxID=552063 RepID=UPI000400AA85|nr:adenosylcobinamide-GDP ribazoletransferase [Salinarimonas rosea]
MHGTADDRSTGHEGPIAGALADVARALRFYSRLPVPALPWEADPHALPDFARMARMLPVAGLILGLLGALVLVGASLAGLPPLVGAGLAIGALAAMTGALHEDGLADVADAFAGATTRARRLEIMKDSRVGAFGATALALALILRVAALAALVEGAGALAAAAAFCALSALSRTATLVPLALADPARADGASASVGRLPRRTLAQAGAIATALALALALAAGLPLAGMLGACLATALAGWAITRWSVAKIGGQTGDVAGAAQQVAEIAAALTLLIALAR